MIVKVSVVVDVSACTSGGCFWSRCCDCGGFLLL